MELSDKIAPGTFVEELERLIPARVGEHTLLTHFLDISMNDKIDKKGQLDDGRVRLGVNISSNKYIYTWSCNASVWR